MLDGACATELERHGINISGPLWSARAIQEAPEAVRSVHRSYLEAGADILLTASYQLSALGFRAAGLGTAEAADATDRALERAVALATEARHELQASVERPAPLVAASLGPYGAALANGAEYHGKYSFRSAAEQQAVLQAFHAERIRALLSTNADLIAFETLPSLDEAEAIVAALDQIAAETGERPAVWFSFTCRDWEHTAHGERVRTCAALLDGVPQVCAIGVNCISPELALPLLAELRTGTTKPLIVYPNSGEAWDAGHRCWLPRAEPVPFHELARSWYAAGAQLVGGCCRTGPQEIGEVAKVAEDLR